MTVRWILPASFYLTRSGALVGDGVVGPEAAEKVISGYNVDINPGW